MTKEKPLEPLGKQLIATGLIMMLSGVVIGSVTFFGSGLVRVNEDDRSRPLFHKQP
jgi:hypothetical protein